MSVVLQGNILGHPQVSVPLTYPSLKDKCGGAQAVLASATASTVGHWSVSVDMQRLGKDDCPI